MEENVLSLPARRFSNATLDPNEYLFRRVICKWMNRNLDAAFSKWNYLTEQSRLKSNIEQV